MSYEKLESIKQSGDDKEKVDLFNQSDCNKYVAKEQVYKSAEESLNDEITAIQSDLKGILGDFIKEYEAHRWRNYPIQNQVRSISLMLDDLYKFNLSAQLLPKTVKERIEVCLNAFLGSKPEYTGKDTLRDRNFEVQAEQEKAQGIILKGEFQPHFDKLDVLISRVKVKAENKEQAEAKLKQLSPAVIAQKRIDVDLEDSLNAILADAKEKISKEGNEARGIKCLCEELLIRRDICLDKEKFTNLWRDIGTLSVERRKVGGYGEQKIASIGEVLDRYIKDQKDINKSDFNDRMLSKFGYQPATAKVVNPVSQPVQPEPSVSFVKPELKQASMQVTPPKPLPEVRPIPDHVESKPTNILQQPTAPITQKVPRIDYVQKLKDATDNVEAFVINFDKKITLPDVDSLKKELTNQINSITVKVPVNEADSPAVQKAIRYLEITKQDKIAELDRAVEKRKRGIIEKKIRDVSTDFSTSLEEDLEAHKLARLKTVEDIGKEIPSITDIPGIRSDLERLVDRKKQFINHAVNKIQEENKVLNEAVLRIQAFKFDFTGQDKPQSKAHLKKLKDNVFAHAAEVCAELNINMTNSKITTALDKQKSAIKQAYKDRLAAIDKEEQRIKQLNELTKTKEEIATATAKAYDFTNLNSGEVNQLKEKAITQLNALKEKLNSLSKLLELNEPQEELSKIAEKQQSITEQANAALEQEKARELEKTAEIPVRLESNEQVDQGVAFPEVQNQPEITIINPQKLEDRRETEEPQSITISQPQEVEVLKTNTDSSEEKSPKDFSSSKIVPLSIESEEQIIEVQSKSNESLVKPIIPPDREEENNSELEIVTSDEETNSEVISFYAPESSEESSGLNYDGSYSDDEGLGDEEHTQPSPPWLTRLEDIAKVIEEQINQPRYKGTAKVDYVNNALRLLKESIDNHKRFNSNEECNFYTMSEKPDSFENYKNSYVSYQHSYQYKDKQYSKRCTYYIKANGVAEKVKINNFGKLMGDLEQIPYQGDAQHALFKLSASQVQSIITSNGGHAPGDKEVLDMFKMLMVCCFQNKKGNKWFNNTYTQMGCTVEKELRFANYSALNDLSTDTKAKQEREKHIATEALRMKLFGKDSFGTNHSDDDDLAEIALPKYGYLEANVLPNYQNMVDMIVEQQVVQYSRDEKSIDTVPNDSNNPVTLTRSGDIDVLRTASSLITRAKSSPVEVPLTIIRLFKGKFLEVYNKIFEQNLATNTEKRKISM
ncbi:Uncharacterised protein [Legionella beliardensis]|uniref:Uncharacterized protein n=1 Tax=Legionella beliardensis TaxID=91822 RepID=A0A378I1L0_9GAMM|nr:hypothetical protein [Legionella beliardensis]STX29039.1 Uncharacterised protein [Legionella beliardensis]